jgi:chromosome partitioning protein
MLSLEFRKYGRPDIRHVGSTNDMTTIAIASQKGGVGKTTIALNLAKGLAARGHHTLAVDNDAQGNLTNALLDDPSTLMANVLSFYDDETPAVHPQRIQQHLDLIGADIRLAKIADRDFEVIFRLREGLDGLQHPYEFILIDCVPSFGYLSAASLYATEGVLIPVKPAPFALQGLKDLFESIDKMQRRLNKELRVVGILLNLVEGRPTKLATELEDVLRKTYGDLVFSTVIHKGVRLEESPAFQQSVMEYEPQGRPAVEFGKVLDELLQRLGK